MKIGLFVKAYPCPSQRAPWARTPRKANGSDQERVTSDNRVWCEKGTEQHRRRPGQHCQGERLERHDSLLAKRPNVEEHLPGFFFCEDERDERGHIGPWAPVLENPEKLAIGASCLPALVREVSWQGSLQGALVDIAAQSLPVWPMTGSAEAFPLEKTLAICDHSGSDRERVSDSPSGTYLIRWNAWSQDLEIGWPGRTGWETGHR